MTKFLHILIAALGTILALASVILGAYAVAYAFAAAALWLFT